MIHISEPTSNVGPDLDDVRRSPLYARREYSAAGDLKIVADVGGDHRNPTVILAHGGGQTRHSWGKAMKELVAADYHVINYDARGHGDSDWSDDGDYGAAHRMQDLLAILSHAKGPAAVVGASMGGNTALYTALTTGGNSIAAVVLVDIAPEPDAESVERIRHFMRANLDGFSSVEEAAQVVAAFNPHRQHSHSSQGLHKNLRLRNGRLYWHWDPVILNIDGDHEQLSLNEAMRRNAAPLDIPALVVRAAQSAIVSPKSVQLLEQVLSPVELVDVAGAGHMVAGDSNDAFNEVVIAFLNRHLKR